MAREYTPLSSLVENKTTFNVVSCDLMKDSELYALVLRKTSPSEVDGIKTEGRRLTLYCAVTEKITKQEIEIDPLNWVYSISEVIRGGDVIEIKWIRPK